MRIKSVFKLLSWLGLVCWLAFFCASCKKNQFMQSGGDLSFSTDTLFFDTLFTSVGSVTKSFKVLNESEKAVKINRINLASGANSFFRLNVNGEPTQDIKEVEIASGDSIYIFVALTVDPNNEKLPFVIDDKVQIVLNEKNYEVPLQAYGQNAHFIDGEFIQTDTWENDLPYVIVNSAAVDTGAVLTIQKGCRIYMHANSTLYVAGTLRVFGTKEDSVIFQGDRLDREYFGYEDYPGEWQGIHFLRTSENNFLSFATIKNGGALNALIYIEPPLNGINSLGRPMVEITKCKIFNSLSYGILSFNSWVLMDNTLLHSCGLQNLAVLEGGTLDVYHGTIVTYGSLGISHINQPVMALLNYRDTSNTGYVGGSLNARFFNTIIYGPLESEIVLANKGAGDYNLRFDHCLLKYGGSLPNGILNINNKFNQDPAFVNRGEFDFNILAGSPAKEAGYFYASYPTDIDNKDRNVVNPITNTVTPTLGCYE